jgi:hypothetical protein
MNPWLLNSLPRTISAQYSALDSETLSLNSFPVV